MRPSQAAMAYKAGLVSEATTLCRQQLRRNPLDAGAMHTLALACAHVGDLSEALRLLQESTLHGPGNHGTWLDLARMASRLGMHEIATAGTSETLARRKDCAPAYALLVRLHESSDHPELARSTYAEWSKHCCARAILIHDAVLEYERGGPVLRRGSAAVRVEGLSDQKAYELVNLLSGRHTLSEISQAIRADISDVLCALREPVELGWVHFMRLEERQAIPADLFAEICKRNVYPSWNRRLSSLRLPQALCDGSASKAVFVGWLLETYHYIDSVSRKIPVVLARCALEGVQDVFMEHFTEEYSHRHFAIQSLIACGLQRADIVASSPLPGTAAVINHMRAVGRQDPLAYAVCSGFLEWRSPDDRRRDRPDFFEQIAQHFDTPERTILRPLMDHSDLDMDAGHSDLIRRVCSCLTEISPDRVDAALSAGMALVETLHLQGDDILARYESRCVPVGAGRMIPLEQRADVPPQTESGNGLTHPIWCDMASPQIGESLIWGYAIETLHVLLAAKQYLMAGVAATDADGDLREQLTRGAIGRFALGETTLRGLCECGFARESLLASRPLASTRALIDVLWEAADHGAFQYVAMLRSLSFLGLRQFAEESFALPLGQRFPATAPVVDVLRQCGLEERQVATDSHQAMSLSAEDEARVAGFAEHFDLFFNGIRGYYSRQSKPTLRRPLSMDFYLDV